MTDLETVFSVMERSRKSHNQLLANKINRGVRTLLKETLYKYRFKSISLISGMGTWIIKVNNRPVRISSDVSFAGTDTYVCYEDENGPMPASKELLELDEFLRLCAGTFNVYANDMKYELPNSLKPA